MAQVVIRLSNEQAQAALGEAMRRCRNMAPVWKDVGEHMVQSTHQNFMKGGRPTPWAPWSASYAEWRAKKHKGRGGILRLRTTLMNSITYRPAADRVFVGTNVPYAAIHQFGGEIEIPGGTIERKRHLAHRRTKSGKVATRGGMSIVWGVSESTVTMAARKITMPARPYLMVHDEDWAEIGSIAMDYISGPLQHQVR